MDVHSLVKTYPPTRAMSCRMGYVPSDPTSAYTSAQAADVVPGPNVIQQSKAYQQSMQGSNQIPMLSDFQMRFLIRSLILLLVTKL